MTKKATPSALGGRASQTDLRVDRLRETDNSAAIKAVVIDQGIKRMTGKAAKVDDVEALADPGSPVRKSLITFSPGSAGQFPRYQTQAIQPRYPMRSSRACPFQAAPPPNVGVALQVEASMSRKGEPHSSVMARSD
jgi:hypothetical protein